MLKLRLFFALLITAFLFPSFAFAKRTVCSLKDYEAQLDCQIARKKREKASKKRHAAYKRKKARAKAKKENARKRRIAEKERQLRRMSYSPSEMLQQQPTQLCGQLAYIDNELFLVMTDEHGDSATMRITGHVADKATHADQAAQCVEGTVTFDSNRQQYVIDSPEQNDTSPAITEI